MYAVIADDEGFLREAISSSLSLMFKFQVLQANSADEALCLTRKHKPSLVLMDMMMPGMNSFDAAVDIRKESKGTKVAIFSGRADVDFVIRSRELRVHGYILKGDGIEEFRYAVNTILRGGIYVPPSLSEHLLDPQRKEHTALDHLTGKERTALGLLAQGLTQKEIAASMGISVKTAETHRNNLGRKLNHPNRAQLISFALVHKLTDHQALALTA
jgi:DNA-binding NarL/FixJ family response regulator